MQAALAFALLGDVDACCDSGRTAGLPLQSQRIDTPAEAAEIFQCTARFASPASVTRTARDIFTAHGKLGDSLH